MGHIIGFDPSINCTGFSIFENNQLIDCGRFKNSGSYQKNRVVHKIPAPERINQMIRDIGDMISDYPEAEFVVEITSGKQAGRFKTNLQGLGTYAMLVGHVVRFLIDRHGEHRVHQYFENDWTRGCAKERRQQHCAHLYPLYAKHWLERDMVKVSKGRTKSGGDVSDAVMIVDYHINRGALSTPNSA